MGPGVLAAGIQQINLLVGSVIASFREGAISYLYYSERVYQLPLGIIGVGLGVILLPEVTKRLRRGVFNICGIKDVIYKRFFAVPFVSEKKRKKFLEDVKSTALNL